MFDEKEFLNLVTKAENYFNQFKGKPGFNPFFKLEEITQLKKQFEKGNKSDLLMTKIKSIELKEPVIVVKTLSDKKTIPVTSPVAAKTPEVAKKDIAGQQLAVDVKSEPVNKPPPLSTANKT